MSGEKDATFTERMEALRPRLRLHCYRMLGSASDCEDLVQETLLRAWRARSTLDDPERLGPWLYRIATHACLDELAHRPRRALTSDLYPAASPHPPYAGPAEDALFVEPMPGTWLTNADDPGSRFTMRESVALAFVAALQVLSPPQRAALLLRDVAGLSAGEAAAALDQSVDATHSALHRARAAVDDKIGRRDPDRFAEGVHAVDRRILERYVRAIDALDLDAMIALMHEEMRTTMPPWSTWIEGRADNVVFYRSMFERLRGASPSARVVSVNDRLGCTFHRDGAMHAVEVIETEGETIRALHHFMQSSVLPLFGGP